MGIGSVLGAFVGASHAGFVEKDILKVLLGAILILATIRIAIRL